MLLLSFDIDGTLEVGDPPGVLPLALVRQAKALGYVVGSASDRVLREQRALWASHAIEMDFIDHKHRLDAVKARFQGVTRCIHIGDSEADRYYAQLHGFEYFEPHALPDPGSAGWIF